MSSPEATTVTYSFHQPVPMPSYLIALAIGALEKRDISERCAVWSEKEMVEAGAHEFAETEVFLKVTQCRIPQRAAAHHTPHPPP